MKRYVSLVGLLSATLALPVGCSKSPESQPARELDPAAVVARFSGGEILRSEIQAAVENRLASVPKPVAAETRQLMVRKVVERRVRLARLVAEAKAKGYDSRPEVQYQAAASGERILATDFVATAVAGVRAADSLVAAAVESRLQSVHPGGGEEVQSHLSSCRGVRLGSVGGGRSEDAGRSCGCSRAARASMSWQSFIRIRWTPGLAAASSGRCARACSAPRGTRSSPCRRADSRRSSPRRMACICFASTASVRAARSTSKGSAAPCATSSTAKRAPLPNAPCASGARRGRCRLAAPRTLMAAGGPGGRWVARWKGGEVSAEEFRALRPLSVVNPERASAFLRELVENRLLAARRRAQGLTPALEGEISVQPPGRPWSIPIAPR